MQKNARTCVYNVNYHIVWSVKYRRSVLDREIEAYLKAIFQEIAEEKGFEVVLWNSSFYIETIGSISEETIRKYIENQKKKG
jgi:putative transposase